MFSYISAFEEMIQQVSDNSMVMPVEWGECMFEGIFRKVVFVKLSKLRKNNIKLHSVPFLSQALPSY